MRLVGKQKITAAEAADMRARFQRYPGPSGDFVTAEAIRYAVNRETVRRILRGETHTTPAAALGASPPAFPAPEAPAQPDAASAAALEADARRLLESLTNPSGDAVVDAFREELKGDGA